MATLADITPHRLTMFWSPACGPSLYMSGVVMDLADELEGIMDLVHFRVEENPEEAKLNNVKFTPTFVVRVDGEVRGTLAGTSSPDQFIDWLAGRLQRKPDAKPKKPRKVKSNEEA